MNLIDGDGGNVYPHGECSDNRGRIHVKETFRSFFFFFHCESSEFLPTFTSRMNVKNGVSLWLYMFIIASSR